jgi:glutathione peroxidase
MGQDFEILAFPSNDFGGQEPLEGQDIATFCSNYGNNFPVFDKIRVRGPYADPLYKFLSDKKENGNLNSVPRWNFHKFLVNRMARLLIIFPVHQTHIFQDQEKDPAPVGCGYQ